MTVRKPLFINSDGDLQEMTDAQVVLHQQKAIHQYSLDPSALLTVVSNSGTDMASITDTRLTSGQAAVSAGGSNSGVQASDFPTGSAGALGNTVDVIFDKINFAYQTTFSGLSGIGPDGGDARDDRDRTGFPVFRNSNGDIQAMTLADFQDTILHPAINLMVVADSSADDSNVAGTYRIHTASSLTDFTEVSGSATPIFTDTTSTGFAASSIPDAPGVQDGSASTVQDFFLMRRNGTDVDTSSFGLVGINSNGDIQEYADHGATLLGNWLKRTAAASTDGFKITYAIGASVSGTQRGSAITNNQLSGSVTSTTSVSGTDTYTTYRAQIFPSGSATVVNTFLFKINKA